MNLWKLALAGLVGLGASGAQAEISTSLVAQYSLNGNANENTGAGPNGVLTNGATLTVDRCGRSASAILFPANGPSGYSSAYIDCGNNVAVSTIGPTFTIGFWIKSSTDGSVIDKDIVGTVNNDWWIAITAGGRPTLGLGSSSVLVWTNVNIADNNWHHVVFTRLQSSGQATCYVDGVSMGTKSGATNGVANSSTLHIGAWDTGNSSQVFREGFVGSIDEVRFYSRVLSASDVSELMALEPCSNPPVNFNENFEANAAGTFPAGWEPRFAGGGQSVVASPAWLGTRSFKEVALPFGAAEAHTLPSWKCASGPAVLEFALRLSSESTNVGGGCADALVVYQGTAGAMQSGFIGSGTSGWVILGTNIPVQLDRWYQFHGVADYDKGTVSWYVDDVLVVACQSMTPGDTSSARANRIEAHVGCIDSGQMVAYFDSIKFTPGIPCKSDHDRNGTLAVADIFAFLSDWFAGCP